VGTILFLQADCYHQRIDHIWVKRGLADAMIEVTGLFVYPIKSCAGTPLSVATVVPRGFEHDREWLIVDAATGEFLTQRECPKLALIRPHVVANGLRIEAPGVAPCVAPISYNGARRIVTIWKDTCQAVDQGSGPARWFTDILGIDCRLVRMADDWIRAVNPAYATKADDQVGFADGYPFLLISEESLADLNGRLHRPLPMNRFRPNIVIAGSDEPFVEDRMRAFRIGTIDFHVVKGCGRCIITTADQETTERGLEPLATLATYRKVDSKVIFGQNLIHSSTGTIRRGDAVTVTDWQTSG
jgi:uncharacterized protein YcbX